MTIEQLILEKIELGIPLSNIEMSAYHDIQATKSAYSHHQGRLKYWTNINIGIMVSETMKKNMSILEQFELDRIKNANPDIDFDNVNPEIDIDSGLVITKQK